MPKFLSVCFSLFILIGGVAYASGTKGSSTKSIGPVLFGTWYTTFEREGKTYIMKESYGEDRQMARTVYLPGTDARPMVYQWRRKGDDLTLSIEITTDGKAKVYEIKRTIVGMKTFSMRMKSADGSILDFTRKPPTVKAKNEVNERRRRR